MPENSARAFVRGILDSIAADLYDRPIITNNIRPHYVERMIVRALGDGWTLVSADWSGWDIESATGVRVEVKQSAVRQTWTDRPGRDGKPTVAIFDIRPRTGYWSEGGSKWVEQPGRIADIFVFAWHPVLDPAIADHRDPQQWRFYVVLEAALPPGQKTISRTVLERRHTAVGYDELRNEVASLCGAD